VNGSRTLVSLGAHPDDESFGVGSTLAQYAAAGTKVYYVCTTGGEHGTVDAEHLVGYDSIKQLRSAELKCACQALGLAGVIEMEYRDSDMRGNEGNKHPDCLAMAPIEEVAERIVKIFREIKPDVVITHDSGGGYGHPDHVATHQATIKAFYAAADPAQYPEAGSAFQPSKLYFGVRPRKLMNLMIKLMPLFGQDPHHFGRNGDVDLTKTRSVEYPIHAMVRIKKHAVEIRNRAVACHASQGGGGGGGRRRPGLFRIIQMIDRFRGPRDYFMREYPPPNNSRREKDLFQGIS
jgi:N-acetyl-1-D-myo-inositol-2-amino-2-deoxy-alpha-D-glucopyranoside deacetylase/mycothiol S-conjugate amidase